MIYIIEPFYEGSHKYFADLLNQLDNVQIISPTQGHSKWHWRMLVSAVEFAQLIPKVKVAEDTILFTAMLNVTELLGLRSDLHNVRKILYFHENQLEYPKSQVQQKSNQSDFNLVWNQIISCICVDHIVFNSEYNRSSFFEKVAPFVNKIPKSHRPPIDFDQLKKKSTVMYVPINIPILSRSENKDLEKILHIVWPHRWEYDKGYDSLIEILQELNRKRKSIVFSVLGESSKSSEDVCENSKKVIQELEFIKIHHWGYVADRQQYHAILRSAHVVLSTSIHEFYGISMMEAVTLGCYPIAPRRLSYPELFPKECLYSTTGQAVKLLFQLTPASANQKRFQQQWQETLLKFNWHNSSCRDTWEHFLHPHGYKRKLDDINAG